MDDLTTLSERIKKIGQIAIDEIKACPDTGKLESLRISHLGKKSELSQVMRGIKDVPADQRKALGEIANGIKTDVDWALAERRKALESAETAKRLGEEQIDVTLPGREPIRGGLHPLTRTLNEIEDIFISMGFEVSSGPDIEDEFHNFEAINIPAEHPARDLQDTLYMKGGGLLRTHTSPVQIRTMQKRQPPIAVIAPGKVYRRDAADMTHSPMFHQIEGFLVAKQVRFSDLKGILGEFLHRMMGPKVQYRFRPSYFPFTEPSAEVDILWEVPGREAQWLEVLGSGMVHPKVLEAGGYDPEDVTGFAFGLGVERFAMLKYGIPNIGHFYENDLRFLRQF